MRSAVVVTANPVQAPASRIRLNLSSGSVHPGTFTLSQDRVTPPRYGLSSSFAT
jgi:hypothetical protein